MNDETLTRVRETVDAIFLTELAEKHGVGPAAKALGLSESAIRKNVADKRCSKPIELAAQFLIGREEQTLLLCRVPSAQAETVLEILHRFGVRTTEVV